jgi:hypothetical protein
MALLALCLGATVKTKKALFMDADGTLWYVGKRKVTDTTVTQ